MDFVFALQAAANIYPLLLSKRLRDRRTPIPGPQLQRHASLPQILALFYYIQYYLFRSPNLCLNAVWGKFSLNSPTPLSIQQSVNIYFSSLSDQ